MAAKRLLSEWTPRIRNTVHFETCMVHAASCKLYGVLLHGNRAWCIGAWCKLCLNGQEHFYLETQAALCVPGEGGEMLCWSSSQAATKTQKYAWTSCLCLSH